MIKKFKQFNESIETLTEYELKIKNMYSKLKRGIGDGILDLGKVGQVSNTVIYDIEKRYPGATVFKKDGRYLLSIKENPVNENTKEKRFSVYKLSFGQAAYFWSDSINDFTEDVNKATLYTEKEAEDKRRELLKPLIDKYQETGKNYQELHIGDLYKKRLLNESRTGNKIIEIYEEIINNVTITDELNIEDIDTVAKSVLSDVNYGFYEQNKEVIIDMLETDI